MPGANDNKPLLLIVCSQAPYSSSAAREALDLALAAATFEQNVAVLFRGDGCYQLLPTQNPKQIEAKEVSKMITALSVFGVEHIYVEHSALAARHITDTLPGISIDCLGQKDIQALYQTARSVVHF